MTDYKKLIMGFGYRNGKTFFWNGKLEYEGRLKELTGTACDSEAGEIFVYDRSLSDESHEAVIGAIKEAAHIVDEPILAGGRIRRLEGAKKYPYAGANVIFPDVSHKDDVDMMKEATDWFGSKKAYTYILDLSYPNRMEEYIQLGVSMMIYRVSGPVLSPTELGEIREILCRSLIFCGGHKDIQEITGDPKLSLGCPQVEDAILTLAEDSLDKVVELKQILKSVGIVTDTFESSLEWENFELGSGGFIPVIIQDYKTLEVLMMVYINEESFQVTPMLGRIAYFSRSRQKLRLKGKASDHFQYMKSLKIDRDNSAILASVKQVGVACHTGDRSRLSTTLVEKGYGETDPLKVFEEVSGVILDHKEHPKEDSYTNYLFDKGIDKIFEKPGEEAMEIVVATKNPDPEETKYKTSNFFHHMMVLMAGRGIIWEETTEELANRW